MTFTIDLTDTTAAKNVDVKQSFVQTNVAENGNITAGKETALQTAAKYYDGKNAQAKDVTVSYKLKGEPEGVTLENNKITVSEIAGLTEVTVIAVYDGFEQEMTIPVVTKQYKVTINMYSPDLDMEPGVSDIYIFENGGSRNTVVNMDKTVTDEENGVTWVQGTTTLPFSSLGIIARDQAGTWDGGKDGDQYYVIDENTSEITLWYVYGKTPVTEKPTITKEDPRYLYLEYENPDKLETTPQFYSWTTDLLQSVWILRQTEKASGKFRCRLNQAAPRLILSLYWTLPDRTGSRTAEITPSYFRKDRMWYVQALKRAKSQN